MCLVQNILIIIILKKMDDKNFFVTILLPSYNEVEAISHVIGEVDKAMSNTAYQYEILVIDDNSSDRTVAVVESLMNENNKIRLIKRKINGGSGVSRKTGLLNAKGDIIVMIDADGTYNAADIPKLLEYFPEYDQVNGARISEEGTYKLLRFSAKWLIRQLAVYLSGYKIPDLNTGLKAFKKEIMLKYLWVIPDGFSCVTTMTLAFLTNGYNVKYIPTRYFKRVGKSKFRPFKDTAKYFQTVLRMIIYFNPLKFFLPSASFILVSGLAWMGYTLYFFDFKIHASQIIMIVVAIQLYVFGFLADLIVSTTKRNL